MASQGSKVITATLVATAILVALTFIVYIERNLGESDGKIPNPKSQIPNKSQLSNLKKAKIGTATILSDKSPDTAEKKVSVPIKGDGDLFDKYPPDKELSIEEHIKYVLNGRFRKLPPDGFISWLEKNRELAIPILLKILTSDASNDNCWKVMKFFDYFAAPEAFDKLYEIATTTDSRNWKSRHYAILALKNYGEKAVDYLMDIYKGDKLSFGSEDDKKLTKANVINALASIAVRPDTKDPKILEQLTSFFREQYYQQDVREQLISALSKRIGQNPRPEFMPFFKMVENDPDGQYKEIAKQSRIKLEVLNSPDADKQLVNILYTNYDYDVPSQDLDTYKAIRTWAAREMANKNSVASANIPVHTRVLHLRNIINTESKMPYNVDDQLIRWCISSIIDLGEELTPEEREILRSLH